MIRNGSRQWLFHFLWRELTKLPSCNGSLCWLSKSKSSVLYYAVGRNSSRQVTHLSHLQETSVPSLYSIFLFFPSDAHTHNGDTAQPWHNYSLAPLLVYRSVSLTVFPVQNREPGNDDCGVGWSTFVSTI